MLTSGDEFHHYCASNNIPDHTTQPPDPALLSAIDEILITRHSRIDPDFKRRWENQLSAAGGPLMNERQRWSYYGSILHTFLPEDLEDDD